MNPDPNVPPNQRSGPAGRPPDDDITWMGAPPGAPPGARDAGAQGGPGGPAPSGRPAVPVTSRTTQERSAVKFTRLSAAWWTVIVGTLFLIVLLIFITQNMESVGINFLGWTWHAPLGVAFLAASVCGALITVMVGAARMIQLRRAAGKNLKRR